MNFISLNRDGDRYFEKRFDTLEEWEKWIQQDLDWSHLFRTDGAKIRSKHKGCVLTVTHTVPPTPIEEWVKTQEKKTEWDSMPWYKKIFKNEWGLCLW